MSKIIYKIAKAIGIKTWYHISSSAPHDGAMRFSDGSYCIRPWITHESMVDIRKVVKLDGGFHVTPNITSITKIGSQS